MKEWKMKMKKNMIFWTDMSFYGTRSVYRVLRIKRKALEKKISIWKENSRMARANNKNLFSWYLFCYLQADENFPRENEK